MPAWEQSLGGRDKLRTFLLREVASEPASGFAMDTLADEVAEITRRIGPWQHLGLDQRGVVTAQGIPDRIDYRERAPVLLDAPDDRAQHFAGYDVDGQVAKHTTIRELMRIQPGCKPRLIRFRCAASNLPRPYLAVDPFWKRIPEMRQLGRRCDLLLGQRRTITQQ